MRIIILLRQPLPLLSSTTRFRSSVHRKKSRFLIKPAHAAAYSLCATHRNRQCGVAKVEQISGLPSGSFFPGGTTINTWKATHDHGNSSTFTQAIVINDTEKPTITAPPPVVSNGCTAVGNVALGEPTVADNCGVQVSYQ
jgi:hypothetical protein